MRILSIGNSFSVDAHRYLCDIAREEGAPMTAVNLYIGGCSLRTHYLNMLSEREDYDLGLNGFSSGVKVRLSQALATQEYDVVTLQQASHFSSKSDTYFPYIEELAEYVREYQPSSKILIHKTWAYEKGSDRLFNVAGFRTPEEMFEELSAAYTLAAERIGADGIIPAGDAMLEASRGMKAHRDTFHASIAGRFLLGLVWYKSLTGLDVTEKALEALPAQVTPEETEVIKNTYEKIFQGGLQ